MTDFGLGDEAVDEDKLTEALDHQGLLEGWLNRSRVVDEALILAGRNGSGGWNARQLALLGVDWPPAKGWIQRSIGKTITIRDAVDFVLLKGGGRGDD